MLSLSSFFSKSCVYPSLSSLKFSLHVTFKLFALVEGEKSMLCTSVASKVGSPRFLNFGLSLRTEFVRFNRMLGSKSATILLERLLLPFFQCTKDPNSFLGSQIRERKCSMAQCSLSIWRNCKSCRGFDWKYLRFRLGCQSYCDPELSYQAAYNWECSYQTPRSCMPSQSQSSSAYSCWEETSDRERDLCANSIGNLWRGPFWWLL